MAALDIESLANALAHVSYFPRTDQAEVLRRLGHEPGAFLEAATTIPKGIADALSSGDQEPAKRFGDALKSSKQRLESDKPKLESIRPAKSGPAPPVDPALDMTMAPPRSAASKPSLPFRAAAPGESPAILRTTPPAIIGASRHTAAGGTLDPAPLMSADERAFESWTIERYAAFSAERRRGDPEEVRRTYGVSGPIAEQALMNFMNRRFAAAPQARDRWQALVAAYLADPSKKGSST